MFKNLIKNGLSSATLKYIAVITMTIDHIGAFIIMPILTAKYGITPTLDPINAPNTLACIYAVTRLIGRVSFPIFAFSLAEGYHYSKNRFKQILLLLLFAFISAIPYSIANDYGSTNIFEVVFNFSNSIMFTMLFAYIIIYLLDPDNYINPSNEIIKTILPSWLINYLMVLMALLLATQLKVDYGIYGLIMIIGFYMLKFKFKLPKTQVLPIMGVLNTLQVTAWLAMFPIALYNNKRGKQDKYFFYVYYPLHLIILSYIRYLILKY